MLAGFVAVKLLRVSSVDSFERFFLHLHICRIGPVQLDRRVLFRGLKAAGFLLGSSMISVRARPWNGAYLHP